MKYFKHIWMIDGDKIIRSYQPEGVNTYIPPKAGNKDFDTMMQEVGAGTSTIEEVDSTPGG
jgi:hypothetical protein